MSHAQDTEMYDKVMRVIIKMELAYNRHNLEKGLVIVLRKVIPLSLCVCVWNIRQAFESPCAETGSYVVQ